MDPNAANPNNVPPADDTTPAQPPVGDTPTPEAVPTAPATPEVPANSVAPAPSEPVAPVEPATPAPVASDPFATPVDPMTPTTPANPMFAPEPANVPGAPKPSNKKKTVLIAAIAGGVVLLAVIGFIVFSLLSTVSKKDYQEATVQYNAVSTASSSLTSDVSTLSGSIDDEEDASFDKAVSDAEAGVAKIKTENDELSKMKAIRFGDGAKLYKPFNEKVKTYLAYATELIDSVKNLRPAMKSCQELSKATDNAGRVAGLKKCATELKGVTDIPNAEMKEFISVIATSYDEYASILEQTSALTNPFGSQYEQYKALRDKMTAVQTKILDASKKMTTALEKRDEEMSVKDSAKALGDFLTEKQK